jgi:hypothetical protein
LRTAEQISVDLLHMAIETEVGQDVLLVIKSDELALVASRQILTCPKCGSEAWCNIDCDLCVAMIDLGNRE